MSNLPDDERQQRDDRWQGIADRTADRSERAALGAAERFERRPGRTILKWLGIFLAVILVLGLIGRITGVIGGYADETTRVISVDNNREQTTKILNDEKSMVVQAGNVCEARAAGDGSNPNDPQIVGGSPEFQFAQLYRQLKADYDRRMANFFEAKLSKGVPIPGAVGHLPKEAPTLKERLADPNICPTEGG